MAEHAMPMMGAMPDRAPAVEQPLRLAVVVGSTREGRFGSVVARWLAQRVAERDGLALDLIELAELDLPAVYPRRHGPAERTLAERIGRADAVVIVTPEYNHGYPAALKQAIDLSGPGWAATPVAFVSYGGRSGGLRAVEQLRQVLVELHATTIRETVSFHGGRAAFDASGHPRDAADAARAAAAMLERLSWWARALRRARVREPYTS